MRTLLLITLIQLMSCIMTIPQAFSDEGRVDYTFGYSINALNSHGDLVWCATNKGVFSFDINTGKESRYQQEDGLILDTISDIAVDADGAVTSGKMLMVR